MDPSLVVPDAPAQWLGSSHFPSTGPQENLSNADGEPPCAWQELRAEKHLKGGEGCWVMGQSLCCGVVGWGARLGLWKWR